MTAADGKTRTAVLVLGMHRSGTSAVTRLIGQLGVTLPRDPLPVHPTNPLGHWESSGLVAIHEDLLRALKSKWKDKRPLDVTILQHASLKLFIDALAQATLESFGDSPVFVVKDPRICRFVPIWRQVVNKLDAVMKIVLVVRNPAEVAASLLARDGIRPYDASALWLRHNADAERHTRDLPRIVITYDDLTADWRPTARRITDLIGCDSQDFTKRFDATAGPAVVANLRHHWRSLPEAYETGEIPGEVLRVYEALSMLAARDNAEERAAVTSAVERAEGAFLPIAS